MYVYTLVVIASMFLTHWIKMSP